MKLRALAVGSGWGAHAARVFAEGEQTRLAGVVGNGSARTEELATELGVPVFTDLGTAIASVRPEIASVAVHETLNAPIVEALLVAGSHVLCSHPVATSAADVARLDGLARAQGRLVATDYSLRLCPGYTALREELARVGNTLRLAIQSPSRTLVISVDLALDLAGPVDRVFAATRYPAALRERVERRPRAFAPTVLLEHASGVVSTLMPVPQADPTGAYHVTVSAERASLRVALPWGRAERLQYLGNGKLDERALFAPERKLEPSEAYGAPMRRLVATFVDSVLHARPVHAPFVAEEAVRRTWLAIERSAAESRPVEVTAPAA